MNKYLLSLCFVMASLVAFGQLKVKGSPDDGTGGGIRTFCADNGVFHFTGDVHVCEPNPPEVYYVDFLDKITGEHLGTLTAHWNGDLDEHGCRIYSGFGTMDLRAYCPRGLVSYYTTFKEGGSVFDGKFRINCNCNAPNTNTNTNQRSLESFNPQITPNPFNDRLTFENFAVGDQILISNSLGQTISYKKVQNMDRNTINTFDLKSGIYAIMVERNGEIVYSKLFVKH